MKFLYERNTLLKIYYWMPDHHLLLQEFVWQLSDIPPNFPRVRGFLHYWHEHIEAVINEVYLANSLVTGSQFINIKDVLKH